jgi:hypothetical protein
MPMHDWTRVPHGIFHAFHHRWVTAISDRLNEGLLPEDYYALPEQQAAGFGPDVLTLQAGGQRPDRDAGGVAAPVRPQTRFTAQTDAEFYRRKKSSIVVRHVSGDEIVAMIEIVSPGNKAGAHAFRAFMDKVYELLEHRIHLLIIDPFPPGRRDPKGVHAAIWEAVEDQPFDPPADKPLTLVSYECDLTTRAYIEPVAVGDVLPDMPLFLEPDAHVAIPLEDTYAVSWRAMPARWRRELESGQS